MNARSARIAAGFVKTIPIDHGKANMPAPAALPARLARSLTRPQEAKRRDCRMAIEPNSTRRAGASFISKSTVGTKRTCRGRLTMPGPEVKTDVPREPGHFRF
jgi:hypothetical protein